MIYRLKFPFNSLMTKMVVWNVRSELKLFSCQIWFFQHATELLFNTSSLVVCKNVDLGLMWCILSAGGKDVGFQCFDSLLCGGCHLLRERPGLGKWRWHQHPVLSSESFSRSALKLWISLLLSVLFKLVNADISVCILQMTGTTSKKDFRNLVLRTLVNLRMILFLWIAWRRRRIWHLSFVFGLHIEVKPSRAQCVVWCIMRGQFTPDKYKIPFHWDWS